jgi:hypothetical protein
MKRIIMLGIVLVAMFVSLGGCFWGDQGRDRGGTGPDNLTAKDMTGVKGMTMTGGEDMWTMKENKDCVSRKLVKP